MPSLAALSDALARAAAHAPFLAGAMSRHPPLVSRLQSGDIAGALDAVAVCHDVSVRQGLRIERDRLALVLAIGDLAGALSLESVVTRLSSFADHALNLAIDDAIGARTPGMPATGFAAIALGKHGSCELNYSSDIDPILLYDPDTIPLRPREDPGEGAVRIARAAVDPLQARDGDGYVFRVDLRLRPASEATPIALPVGAAISHYESSALAWERAAFIRARAAAGDTALGRVFLDAIRPFVWRRSLDFGAIGELRAMSQRIRAQPGARSAFGPGFDLKRGRGGIREIEFYVQIQQLIHGGRDPDLRVPDTLGAIAALATAGRIDGNVAATLADAYRLFRTIEHRLQMVDDRQTHSVPQGDALESVARLHGVKNGAALLALLAPSVEAVGALYDALDGDDPVPMPVAIAPVLEAAGYADPAALARRIGEWRSGKVRALRSAPALAALEAALPSLIAAFARAPDPDATLAAFDRLVSGLPSALNLFRLLQSSPSLQRLLVDILSHAPALADALGRHPALLDRLIDASAFDPVGTVPVLFAEMDSAGNALEDTLDRVRQVVGDHRFALGTQIVEGAADPLDVATGYARVAEAAIVAVASAVVSDFEAAHGRVPGSELVVLALGRLGGGLLTHASDLDLIYLFTGDHLSESDGARPLGASHYYNRLAQRLSAGLSAPTSAGALYDVDTRLRPSGTQGPLVVSFDSFERYQRESAWTWEHMALTRARPVFGSDDARTKLRAIIGDVLCSPREAGPLARAIVDMRREIAMHKAPLGNLDVKLGDGGLVDLEFVVHFVQLATGTGVTPDLRAAIRTLADAGQLDPALLVAHDLMTRMIVTFRLVSPTMIQPSPATCVIVARACGAYDWGALLEQLEDARQSVRAAWARIVASAGEDDD